MTTNGDTTARYGYDANGNRTRVVASGDTIAAEYDTQDRLLSVVTSGGDTTRYAYTGAGELQRAVTGPDTTRYTYDALGNLLRVVVSGDTIEYVIDGLNRRVGRKVNGAWTHRWLYADGLRPVAELDGTGALVARYVYGTRGHVPDYVVRGDSVYRLVTDQLGSVRGVVNVATGAVVERIAYDAWGVVKEDTQPGYVSLGYAGGLRDAATGLVRFGARDYDARVGRWTCKDPVRFGGGTTNLYSYVASAPTNNVDPLGLGMHHYNCRQTLQLLQWAREDAAGPFGLYLALRNHAWPGLLDFCVARGRCQFRRAGDPRSAQRGCVWELPCRICGLLCGRSQWWRGGPRRRATL